MRSREGSLQREAWGVGSPANVSHTINLGSAGNHKVLAIWNIGDTAMAFYSCIDVRSS